MNVAYTEVVGSDGRLRGEKRLVTSPEQLVLKEKNGAAVAEKLRKTRFGIALLAAFDDHTEKGPSFADPSTAHERLHPFEDSDSYMFHKNPRVINAMCNWLETIRTEPDSVRNALGHMKRDFLLFFSRIIYPYFFNFDRVISYEKRHTTGSDEEFARRYAELDADAQFSLLLLQPQVASLLRIEDFRETTADGIGRIIKAGTDTLKRKPIAHSRMNGFLDGIQQAIVIDEVDRLLRTEEKIKQLFEEVPENFKAYVIHTARSFMGELNPNKRNEILRKTSNVLSLIGDELQRNAARNCLDELKKEIDIHMKSYSYKEETLEGHKQKPKRTNDLPGQQAQAVPCTNNQEKIEKRRPESAEELTRLFKSKLQECGATMFYTDENGQSRSTDDDNEKPS